MTKVIAEIGINHNGDVQKAWDMIDSASACGADYVKFQKRDVGTCYTPEELKAPCESPWGDTVEAKVRGRELAWGDFNSIADKCDMLGIGWTASCFDLKSLRELEGRFGSRIAFHKVPSAMAKHLEFLELVASFGRLTLVSVGLAEDFDEVEDVCRIFEERGCPYVLNVTTALYPTPIDRCHVSRISSFLEVTSRVSGEDHVVSRDFPCCYGVGYSGHEVGLLPSVIASVLGASYIERHFTLDRSSYGGDQAASLEPEGMRRLCRDISQIESAMGGGNVALEGDEKNPVPNLRKDPDE